MGRKTVNRLRGKIRGQRELTPLSKNFPCCPCFMIRCQCGFRKSNSAALAGTSVPDSSRTLAEQLSSSLRLLRFVPMHSDSQQCLNVAMLRFDRVFHGDNTGSNPVGDDNKRKTSLPRLSLPGKMSRNPGRHKRRREWLPGQHPPRTRSQRVFGSWLFVDQGGYRPSRCRRDCRLSQYVTMESV
jgi:hypothetical protein